MHCADQFHTHILDQIFDHPRKKSTQANKYTEVMKGHSPNELICSLITIFTVRSSFFSGFTFKKPNVAFQRQKNYEKSNISFCASSLILVIQNKIHA